MAERPMEHFTVDGVNIFEVTDAKARQDVSDLKDDLSNVTDTVFDSVVAHTAEYTTSYSNSLNNAYVWVVAKPIPSGAKKVSLGIMSTYSGFAGDVTVVFLKKNTDGTYTVIDTTSLTTVAGRNLNNVVIPSAVTFEDDVYIGFYSIDDGMAYSNSGETESLTRFAYSNISLPKITASGSFNMNFSYALSYLKNKETVSNGIVIVSPDGTGDYTDVYSAMMSEAEGTTIYIRPGVYEQDMTACLQKRIILIGADRSQCVIRNTDGRYGHHALYISCGYFENLTIEEPYVDGVSHTVGVSDLGAYAVHIDTDDDYAVGKTCEFYHCTITSDFFPAVGLGMRKDAMYIFDDCTLMNNQIVGRGDYSDEGTLGALYFHDSNGEQGDQYIKVKNCVLKSNLQYAMCPYKVTRDPQNNHVYCDFVNNVLYSETGKYLNTVWFRGDPFNPTDGIFSIEIGYGNTIASLNNV